jgi:hypothetical protein
MKKQRLYAIVVRGLDRDNIVFSVGPYSQEVYTRKGDGEKALREMVRENVEARAKFSAVGEVDPEEAIREARRHYRRTWQLATFERVS